MATPRETTNDEADVALAKVASAPQLPYGVAVPLWRRRRWRRAVLALLLLASVVGLVRHFYGQQIAQHVRFAMKQRAMLNYREDPATVLYGQSEGVAYDNVSSNILGQLTFIPSHGDALLTDDYAGFVDDSDLPPGGGALPAGRQYNRLVFLHSRTSPNGTERLVEVGVSMSWSPREVGLTARVRLFEPGSLLHPHLKVVPVANRREADGGIIPSWPGGVFKLYDIPYGHTTTLYAAQPHPDDASAFLIPYVLDGQKGMIRGRLLDGDRVVFDARPTALATAPATRN